MDLAKEQGHGRKSYKFFSLNLSIYQFNENYILEYMFNKT